MTEATPTEPVLDPIDPVDIDIQLTEHWTAHRLDDEATAQAIEQIAAALADQVDDATGVARDTYAEFLLRIGGGGDALFYASLDEELDDTVLAATLTVTRNDLTGDLDAWRDVYEASIDTEVAGAEAIRVVEDTTVQAEELFDEPITICSWRYVVAFGPSSVLIFAFSTPNHELREEFEEHIEAIMAHVTIEPSGGPAED